MRLGLHALGIGNGADRAVIDAVAAAADSAGFATLWSGEHVVMVDESASRYPYSDDGRIAVPAAADWIDPLIGLSFAAAATSTIRIATGVLLLPEHNPVLVAKQAATLDTLSGGRLTLGHRRRLVAGGVRRAGRAVRAQRRAHRRSTSMRSARCGATTSPHSTANSSSFDSVRVNPKPVRDRRIPIVLGGNSDAALRRVAAWGDGWYGFNLADVEAVGERVALPAHAVRGTRTRPRRTTQRPWRCAICNPPMSLHSPRSASTSWCSSRDLPKTPATLRTGCGPCRSLDVDGRLTD